MRAIVKVQNALKLNPSLATKVGESMFPPVESDLIAELIERDLPYYDPSISTSVVTSLNRFAQNIGLLSGPAPYEQVVATQFRNEWLG